MTEAHHGPSRDALHLMERREGLHTRLDSLFEEMEAEDATLQETLLVVIHEALDQAEKDIAREVRLATVEYRLRRLEDVDAS